MDIDLPFAYSDNFLLKYTPMMTVREKRSLYQVRSDNIKVIDKRGCPYFTDQAKL